MRVIILTGLVMLLGLAFEPERSVAAPPAPGPPAEGYVAARVDTPPSTPAEQRNWLLARLIVDQNFDAGKVRSIEQKLLGMSPDQLDVLVRVYQQKQQQRDAMGQAVLNEARENLEQLKATRDAVAEDVANVRAARQQQYLNYGVTYGGTPAMGFGYSPFGFGPGAAAAFLPRPFGMAVGYGPAFGYAPPYGYGGFPALGYRGAFGYGAPYPVAGGLYGGGWGAGY